MAYDEQLAARVQAMLKGQRVSVEKKMFGGLACMSQRKMFAGILNGNLVVRMGPDANDKALKEPHTRPMDFTGRPMKGYVYAGPDGVKTTAQWRTLSLAPHPTYPYHAVHIECFSHSLAVSGSSQLTVSRSA